MANPAQRWVDNASAPITGGDAAGFTLIELVVVILIVSTLGAVVADRLLFYQEAAEKAAMEQTVGSLRSALHLRIADRLIKGKPGGVQLLAQDNPMDWLAEQPDNYLGERFAPKPGEVPRGSWYFDLNDRQLVYIPKRAEHLVPDASGRKQVRFRVALIYEKRTKEQAFSAENKQVEGVILALATPYQWF